MDITRWNDRYIWATFIINSQYKTVLSLDYSFTDTLTELLEGVPDYPPVLVQAHLITDSQARFLRDNDLTDYVFGEI